MDGNSGAQSWAQTPFLEVNLSRGLVHVQVFVTESLGQGLGYWPPPSQGLQSFTHKLTHILTALYWRSQATAKDPCYTLIPEWPQRTSPLHNSWGVTNNNSNDNSQEWSFNVERSSPGDPRPSGLEVGKSVILRLPSMEPAEISALTASKLLFFRGLVKWSAAI